MNTMTTTEMTELDAGVRLGSAVVTKAISVRTLVATVIGNWLEFFDFTVYSFFAVTIGRQFFPVASPRTQLLLSVSAFGVGFLMRPLGGVVIGAYADRAGRKAAMTLTVLLMAMGTAMIGLTPTYASIGLAAPIMIVLARLLQGFSAGGEVGASTCFLIEAAPPGRVGYYGSWQYATQGVAILTGSLAGYLLSIKLSAQDMEQWGWRVPFLVGIAIAPIGMYIRNALVETLGEEAHQNSSKRILSSVFGEYWRVMLTGFFAICGVTVSSYIIGHYMTTYALQVLRMPQSVSMLASVVAGVVIFFGSLAGGVLSDRFGRTALMGWPRLLLILSIYPGFLLINTVVSPLVLMLVVAGLTLFQAMSTAVVIVAIPESFPAAVRGTGLAVTYAVGVTVFGGSAQVIATWLLDATGDPLSPAWYLIGANIVSLVALFFLRPALPSKRAN